MHLFVYGTLRCSALHPMHRLLHPAEFVGAGSFQGRLYDVGSYPAAVASDDPADTVFGEVYLLREPADTLAALDQYEGYAPGDPALCEYRRAVADIRMDSGQVIPAQIYLYQWPLDNLTRITAGDYLDWLARKPSGPADAPEK